MQQVEVSGKTLDEARRTAAAKLGVSVDEIEATVLEESKGLFGKGQVRIRAVTGASGKAAEEAAPEQAQPDQAQQEAPAAKRRGRAKESPAEDAPAPERPPSRRKPAPKEEPVAKAVVASDEPAQEQEGPAATQEDGEAFAAIVRGFVKSADLEVQASVKEIQERYVNIELDGRDVAHLIGKHGEVLNAMQYLVNIIASRKMPNGIRATLDGNNYRRRREDALTALASKIAEQVAERGEEAVLDALPAFERRIVHKALSDMQGVTTYSEGEEPNRRVVIAPAE